MPASGTRRTALLAAFPNLKAIFSLGAGVDELVTDPDLPKVPVVRIVDPDLTMRMTEYVVLHVLMHHRRQRLYDTQQRVRMWRDSPQPLAREVSVGVMGLGVLGGSAAAALQRLGFHVARLEPAPRRTSTASRHSTARRACCRSCNAPKSWCACCRRRRPPRAFSTSRSSRQLRRDGALGGAYLINAGRGSLQVDADIIAALDQGIARGRHPRRVSDRAAAGFEPALGSSQGDDHAA